MAQAQASAYAAPEIQMGGRATSASSVYALGVLLLQLLTGSEANGLLSHVQRALERGRLSDVIDPCAEGVSPQQALELANLAIRSAC